MYKKHPVFFNNVLLLDENRSEEQVIETIGQFLFDYPMHDIREKLSKMAESSMVSNVSFDTSQERQELLTFCKKLEIFLEATLCWYCMDYN